MKKFRFDPETLSIIVGGVVEGDIGEANVTLVLDTGASFTHLPWRVVEAVGYDPATTRKRINIVTGSGVETAPKLKVKRLRALGVEMENIEIVCHDLPPEARVDGLLGLNFLRNFDIHIQFKQGIIEIR
jgi:aspartyl protease family protein